MIVIYATKTCAFCKHVEAYLTMKNVKYQKVMLDDNPKLRQEVINKSHAMTVPITVKGDWESYVVGWNIASLNKLIS